MISTIISSLTPSAYSELTVEGMKEPKKPPP